MKKENTRMDACSRERFPKEELFRLTCSPSPSLEMDRPLLGRGLYLHKDKATIEKARQRKILERAFKSPDLSYLYEMMEELL